MFALVSILVDKLATLSSQGQKGDREEIFPRGGDFVSVCVCVCMRERERERTVCIVWKGVYHFHFYGLFTISLLNFPFHFFLQVKLFALKLEMIQLKMTRFSFLPNGEQGAQDDWGTPYRQHPHLCPKSSDWLDCVLLPSSSALRELSPRMHD